MSKGNKGGTSHQDVSLLRQAIPLGMKGVKQILHTMKVGTEEMKDVLLNQCNIIFECKVCRGMFRGFANLVAHKRVYCQDLCEDESLLLPVAEKSESETLIIQPEQPKEKTKNEEWDNFIDTDDEDGMENTEKKPTVIDQMLKGEFVGTSEEYKFYTKAVEREGRKRKRKRDMTIKLESVPGVDSVVTQKCEGNGDSNDNYVVIEPRGPKGRGRPRKKKKVDVGQVDEDSVSEKSLKQEDDVVVIEPQEASGHIHMNLRHRNAGNNGTLLDQLKKRPDCDAGKLECSKCKTKYSSVKTLHFHMVSQHSEKRTFYPCVKCSAVFAQMWGVTRHLTTAHGLSRQAVRAMTADIRKGAFEKSMQEVWELDIPKGYGNNNNQSNSNSTAVSVKKEIKGKGEESSAEQLGLNFIMHRCKGCMKIFGKKDMHDRHAKICNMVKKESNKPAKESSSQQTVKSGTSSQQTVKSGTSSQQTVKNGSSNSISVQSSGSIGSGTEISAIEMQQIQSIIDENSQQCLKCYRMFGSVSNLHRHAIRHLGWRRFKCKFCRFLCYNRSECRRHLRVVHHKVVHCKAAHLIDKFIDSVEPQSVMEGGQPSGVGKGRLPRVNMQSSFMNKSSSVKLDNTIRTRAGVYQKDPHKPETMLVTRSGTYRKPTFAELTKNQGNDSEDSDSSAESSSSVTEDKQESPDVNEKKQDEEEQEEEVIEMKKDLTDSRNRRKSQNPNKGYDSPSKLSDDTPAMAKPASHILQSPAKTPTKTPLSNPGTPNGSKTNASANKTQTVNILSKSSSLPKFSISGGVTTVRLPVFTQCIQIQSSMRGNSGNVRLIHKPTNILPKPDNVSQGPQVRILGPNFQLPGSSGGSQVRTIAVSSLPTSTSKNTFTITGANIQGMPLLRPVRPLVSGSLPITQPPELKLSEEQPTIPMTTDYVPGITTITTTAAQCQLSPAMPNLDPISSCTTNSDVVSSSVSDKPVVISNTSQPMPINFIPVSVLPQQITSNTVLNSEAIGTSNNLVIMPANTGGKNVIILKSNSFAGSSVQGTISSVASSTGAISLSNSSPIMTVRKITSMVHSPKRSLTPQPISSSKIILEEKSRSFTPSPTSSTGPKKDLLVAFSDAIPMVGNARETDMDQIEDGQSNSQSLSETERTIQNVIEEQQKTTHITLIKEPPYNDDISDMATEIIDNQATVLVGTPSLDDNNSKESIEESNIIETLSTKEYELDVQESSNQLITESSDDKQFIIEEGSSLDTLMVPLIESTSSDSKQEEEKLIQIITDENDPMQYINKDS